ncbi:MAG: putative O-glycosylation ligase, exosortase A system-associated [Candidatus Methylumidiphilus sp.]
MRDYAIFGIVIACFVVSLRKPYIGFLCWIWLSMMTPHKLAYGFVVDMPVAQICMIGLLIGTLIYREKGNPFQHGLAIMQMLFYLWTAATTALAIFPESSWVGFDKFSRIMLGIFLSYILVASIEKLKWLMWVIYLSIGYYGIKGGLFTLRTGGANRVWGPDTSFIADNNALACALLMIMPLGFYLMTISTDKRINMFLVVSLGLIGVSVLGSNSRGAFVGLLAMLLFWMRKVPGKQKILAALVAVFIGFIAVAFMPESFWNRMDTVNTYEQDASAMGRINAWWCAFNLAKDRPFGAGFDYASRYAFSLYAPNPNDVHTAHSIYFQVIGDHGFIGIFMFLIVLLWTWLLLGKIIKDSQKEKELAWANHLARMLQLSLISYMTAGAFLSLSYYDLYWQISAIAVILNRLVQNEKKGATFAAHQTSQPSDATKGQPKPFVKPVAPVGANADTTL